MFYLKQLTSKVFFAGEQEDAIDNLITVMDLTNAQWYILKPYREIGQSFKESLREGKLVKNFEIF